MRLYECADMRLVNALGPGSCRPLQGTTWLAHQHRSGVGPQPVLCGVQICADFRTSQMLCENVCLLSWCCGGFVPPACDLCWGGLQQAGLLQRAFLGFPLRLFLVRRTSFIITHVSVFDTASDQLEPYNRI